MVRIQQKHEIKMKIKSRLVQRASEDEKLTCQFKSMYDNFAGQLMQ